MRPAGRELRGKIEPAAESPPFKSHLLVHDEGEEELLAAVRRSIGGLRRPGQRSLGAESSFQTITERRTKESL